jgi:hypothetical protein
LLFAKIIEENTLLSVFPPRRSEKSLQFCLPFDFLEFIIFSSGIPRLPDRSIHEQTDSGSE